MTFFMAILGFFLGLFISCVVASVAGLPHPMALGTFGWLLLLGWLMVGAVDRAKQERLERLRIVQASVEAQAREMRDEKLVNRPLWDE
jgi:hypothetical protein